MARLCPVPPAPETLVLHVHRTECSQCGRKMHYDYSNQRTVRCLTGSKRLKLCIRRCANAQCPCFHRPVRPEEERALALPDQEFGLDVIALIGMLRHRDYRSVPEIHTHLSNTYGLLICQRTVTNLLACYEELVAVRLAESSRLRSLLSAQGRAILAIDGMAPAVGHEVLWVIRECLSGEILLARTMLSATGADIASLLREVVACIDVPVEGVISDGQTSIRRAVEMALPGTVHQLCQFHYLREASRPIYEADRHAKKELKKRVRGVREIERNAPQEGEEAAIIAGYTAAVRTALDDEGRTPLAAPGVRLRKSLTKISASIRKVEKKGGPAGRSRA